MRSVITVLSTLVMLIIGPSAGQAYNCDDDQVVQVFQDMLFCNYEFNCSVFGVSSRKEAAKLTEQQIRSVLIEKNNIHRMEEWERGLYEQFLQAQVQVTMIPINWSEAFQSYSTDYNEKIKRFECEAIFQFNKKKVSEFISSTAIMSFFMQETSLNMMKMLAFKNPDVNLTAWLHASGLWDRTMSLIDAGPLMGQQIVPYSVQPNSKGGFLVVIKNTDRLMNAFKMGR
jgi:hypothetical protein